MGSHSATGVLTQRFKLSLTSYGGPPGKVVLQANSSQVYSVPNKMVNESFAQTSATDLGIGGWLTLLCELNPDERKSDESGR